VHAVEHEGHGEQVAVLEGDHGPDVFWSGPVGVDLRQQAERVHYYPHPDPAQSHQHVAQVAHPLHRVLRLDVPPRKRHHYVTGVVSDQDHGARRNLVAHRREQDQRHCHRVVEDVLVKLPLGVALDDEHLEEGEGVDAELDHEVHFEFGGGVHWPAGVLLVDLGAGAAAAGNGGEPVLTAEEVVGEDGDEGVEDAVEGQFEHEVGLVVALVCLVLGVDDGFDPALHEVEPGVFG